MRLPILRHQRGKIPLCARRNAIRPIGTLQSSIADSPVGGRMDRSTTSWKSEIVISKSETNISLNPKFEYLRRTSYGGNPKQIRMTEMTLSVILRRSRRIWPAKGEILRFAQNDSKAVSFENLNIRILNLFRASNFGFRIPH